MRRTRILVADPLRIFRSGVRNLLLRESDFEVVEAATFDDVLEAIDVDCPDVALIDLDLPPLGGVAAVQRLSHFRYALHDSRSVAGFKPSRKTVLSLRRALGRPRVPAQGDFAGRARARVARHRAG